VEPVGSSSITVVMDMTAEALVSGQRRLAVRGSFEMVAVDEAGRPVAIAPQSKPGLVEETSL